MSGNVSVRITCLLVANLRASNVFFPFRWDRGGNGVGTGRVPARRSTPPRTRYSVFCDEHHREQLIHAGLERVTPRDACDGMAGRCRQIIRACESGAITRDEVFTSLFDLLVHAGMHGLERCWGPCLDVLPAEEVAGLRAYADADRNRGGLPVASVRGGTT